MTKVKICGLRTEADVAAVNTCLPDYVGFVFARGKRQIAPETARRLRKRLDSRIRAVGVFVDQDPELAAGLVRDGTIDCVQLHGGEDAAYIRTLRERVGCVIIKAVPVGDTPPTAPPGADHALYDTAPGQREQRGGNGRVFDWSLLRGVRGPFFLAGGLDCGNVAAAVRAAQPYCVDVSSGVETDGQKDPDKIVRFMQIIREMNEMENGRYGPFGGRYIPETLMSAVRELEDAYEHYKDDPQFRAELTELLNNYAGRPSLLYQAKNLTRECGGAQIYLKREDLNHTGSHKINNVLGQTLLAKKMGKTRVIAETGAGQHGVAAATAAALMGMECEVFMGREDVERQALNVYRMRLLGSKVHVVESGTMTLKDAVNETMREWSRRVDDTHYVLGSVMGPHPFPMMVRDFQAVIGREIREQLAGTEGRLPDAVVACVGGGSNAMGAFFEFIGEPSVRLIGCEGAGEGTNTARHAATMSLGSVGVLHGMKSLFCQDEFGQIMPVYSISAGLDYPGIGPEHAWLKESGRAEYVPVTDDEAVEAFERLSRAEGIIPAIESSHAVAHAVRLAASMEKNQIIVVCVSGRGDKDVAAIARYRGEDLYE